jgi:hypothetical protein
MFKWILKYWLSGCGVDSAGLEWVSEMDLVNTVMNMRSEVLTALSVRITFIWYVTPCSLLDKYQVFEERAASIFSTEG